MGNPLAVQLYTVREELADDRDGVLRRIAAFGYGAVEPFDVITDPAGLRRRPGRGRAGGLQRARAGRSASRPTPRCRGARAVGADTVIVPYMPPARFADADGVRGAGAGAQRHGRGRAGRTTACGSATTTTTSSWPR